VLTITNSLATTVEASIRAGSSDRWSVHPFKLRLKPKQSCEVELKLKVLRFGQVDKAVVQGQRDTFHLRTQLSDQQFQATFFLDPSLGSSDPARHPSADKRSELDSPGGGTSKDPEVLQAHILQGCRSSRGDHNVDGQGQVCTPH
jgi:hypothetical protein